MKSFRIHVITNHGQGKKFISEIQVGDESEMLELQKLLMNSFGMVGEDGETYLFPADVCHSSVIIIVPEGG